MPGTSPIAPPSPQASPIGPRDPHVSPIVPANPVCLATRSPGTRITRQSFPPARRSARTSAVSRQTRHSSSGRARVARNVGSRNRRPAGTQTRQGIGRTSDPAGIGRNAGPTALVGGTRGPDTERPGRGCASTRDGAGAAPASPSRQRPAGGPRRPRHRRRERHAQRQPVSGPAPPARMAPPCARTARVTCRPAPRPRTGPATRGRTLPSPARPAHPPDTRPAAGRPRIAPARRRPTSRTQTRRRRTPRRLDASRPPALASPPNPTSRTATSCRTAPPTLRQHRRRDRPTPRPATMPDPRSHRHRVQRRPPNLGAGIVRCTETLDQAPQHLAGRAAARDPAPGPARRTARPSTMTQASSFPKGAVQWPSCRPPR
jgi:hypothetical protein